MMIMLQPERLIPRLYVADVIQAVAFYQQVLGAQQMPQDGLAPGSEETMVELRVGAAVFQIQQFGQEGEQISSGCWSVPKSVTLHLRVEDCDAVVTRALARGAELIAAPNNMVWGERYARIRDPFGHEWSFAQPLTQSCRSAA
jgi:PhnB protein